MTVLDNHYSAHWDDKFRSRAWGRYPPEELVRFMGRNYANLSPNNRADIKVLEVGCGPGANIWFLHREGFHVAGIDGSPTAIEQTANRLKAENSSINHADLKAGDFSSLPWDDNTFDVVIDIFAVYANPVKIIDKTIAEIHRVIKPGGFHFCKLWGTGCTGYGEGEELEPGTFDELSSGPCAGMGLSHFFTEMEIRQRYAIFDAILIDRILRSDSAKQAQIEEFACQFSKSR